MAEKQSPTFHELSSQVEIPETPEPMILEEKKALVTPIPNQSPELKRTIKPKITSQSAQSTPFTQLSKSKTVIIKPQVIFKENSIFKAIFKPKSQKLAEILKASYQPNTLSKCLFDQKIIITVKKLMAITPEIEKILTKALAEREVAEFQILNFLAENNAKQKEDKVNYPSFSSASALSRDTFWFAIGCLTAQVALDRTYKLLVLLKSGSQVNVMNKSIMLRAELAMHSGSKIRFVSHNRSFVAFLGICENVEMDIRGLIMVCSIFVVEKASYALVLGQLFLVKTRFQQTYKRDNVFDTISNEYQTISVIFRTLILSRAGHTD